MFAAAHISRFVYVDDQFGSFANCKDVFWQYVRGHVEEADFIEHPEVMSDEFEDWWKNATEQVLAKYAERWNLVTEGDKLKDLIDEVVPNEIEKMYLSPQEFEVQSTNLINNLDENRQLLILVDLVLDGYHRNGEDILKQYANKEYVNCALLSGTFSVADELSKWEQSQDKNNVFVLSKERIEDGSSEKLMEGLRNVLWLKQISQIKAYTKNMMGNAIKSMEEKIDAIDPSTFHKVVMDKSSVEGCWEFETLMRIVMAYVGLGIKDHMKETDFAGFQTLTRNLRTIRNNAKSLSPNDETVRTISEEEIYLSGEYINQTFSPICNGDVFKIKEKEYILLCQPCNLAIRNDGRRSGNNLEQAFLIPLRTGSEDGITNKYFVQMRKRDAADNIVAELGRYFCVSLMAMDLVSYNPEGKSIIDISKSSSTHPYKDILQDNMMKRYDNILERVSHYKKNADLIDQFELNKQDKTCMVKDFCRPYELGDSHHIKKPKISSQNPSEIDFGIIRVRRYRDPYARDLLQLFMNYLSRPGYDVELFEKTSEDGDGV